MFVWGFLEHQLIKTRRVVGIFHRDRGKKKNLKSQRKQGTPDENKTKIQNKKKIKKQNFPFRWCRKRIALTRCAATARPTPRFENKKKISRKAKQRDGFVVAVVAAAMSTPLLFLFFGRPRFSRRAQRLRWWYSVALLSWLRDCLFITGTITGVARCFACRALAAASITSVSIA